MIGSEAVSCNVKHWISGYQKLAALFQKWHVILHATLSPVHISTLTSKSLCNGGWFIPVYTTPATRHFISWLRPVYKFYNFDFWFYYRYELGVYKINGDDLCHHQQTFGDASIEKSYTQFLVQCHRSVLVRRRCVENRVIKIRSYRKHIWPITQFHIFTNFLWSRVIAKTCTRIFALHKQRSPVRNLRFPPLEVDDICAGLGY